METQVARVHTKEALAAYAESLVVGARVAVFGDPALGLGARLVGLGARDVEVHDPDRARARGFSERAIEGVVVRPYAPSGPTLGPLDLALVPDLGAFEEPATFLARVRDALGDEGVAVIAASNKDVRLGPLPGFDYYELFDLVAREFRSIRMVAELPFRGVAFVALGEEDELPGVSVDTQLADGERAASSYVVLASQRAIPSDLQAYTIIELPGPAAGEPHAASPPGADRVPRRAEQLEALLATQTEQLDAQIEQLEAQAEQLDVQTEQIASQAALMARLQDRAASAERSTELAVKLDGALRAQSLRSSELEGALVESARQLSDLSAELEGMRVAAEFGRAAVTEIEELARRVERGERRARALEQELAGVGEPHALELHRFESALRERAQAARALELELARRDQMVRELVGALEEVSPGGAVVRQPALDPGPQASSEPGPSAAMDRALEQENARLRRQLDDMAADLARRQGESQAMAWTLSELERRLEQLDKAAPDGAAAPDPADEGAPDGPLDPTLAAALNEADALRRALAQEHEARVRAESAARETR